MGDETNAEPISEQPPSAAPDPAAPAASAEVTKAHDSSTTPEDSSDIQVPGSEPREGEGEQPVSVRHNTLSFLQPGTQPGSLGRLGHFEVLELLGKGGFGIVLKALDDKLQRLVAIKVLGPQLTGSANARSRFVREARAAAAVNSKYVVSTYEVYEQPIPYLVMEYVAGKSLQNRLDRLEPFATRAILRIGAEIAAGLAAAHHQGLIHRDIKPANILLEAPQQTTGGNSQGMPLREQADSLASATVTVPPLGRVKIADFGLARAVDDISMTQSGMVAGTPLFMSPEQARGETLDSRSDLFSLGSVLYTLCTSHPPFKAHTSIGVLKRVCDDTPRPIRELSAAIPESLVAIINRLLVKDPAGRFQTAAEVAERLEQHLAHLDDPALPSPPSAGVGAKTTGPLPHVSAKMDTVPSPTKKARRRRTLGLWAAACVLLVAVGSLLLFLLPPGPPDPGVPEGNANVTLAQRLPAGPNAPAVSGLALALSHQRRGERDKARQAYRQAIAALKPVGENASLRALVREALREFGLDGPEAEVLLAAAAGTPPGALTEAIQKQPDQAAGYLARGDWYGRRGLWRKAADDLAAAHRLQPRAFTGMMLGILLARIGEADRYRDHCKALVDRFAGTTSRYDADQTLKLCCLLGPVPAGDPARLARLAEVLVSGDNSQAVSMWFNLARGMYEHRTGRCDAAIATCRANRTRLKAEGGQDAALPAAVSAVEALALLRSGDTEGARRLLAEAKNLIDEKFLVLIGGDQVGQWYDLLVAQLLYREAESLLALAKRYADR